MNSKRDQDRSERFSLVEILMTPFTAVREVFDEYSTDNRRSRHDEKTMAERIMGWVTLPFRLFAGWVMFLISSWSMSRNGFAFLKSLPVLFAVGGFSAALLAVDLLRPEGKQLAHNTKRLRFHAGKSPEHCEMFARNLIELKTEPEYLYELGLSYHRNAQPAEAFDVMRSLAVDNMYEQLGQAEGGSLEITPGFSMAHVWLSDYYNKTRTLDITDGVRDALVEQHLQCAVQTEPENRLAQYQLAMLHFTEVQKLDKDSPEYETLAEKTVKELENVVSQDEGNITRLQLLAMPKLIGLQIELADDDVQLQNRLHNQITKLTPWSERYPDEVDILLTMVRCALLMEDYPRALRIVQNGFRQAQSPVAKRQILAMLSQVYLEHAGKYEDLTDPIQFRSRVHTLSEAVTANPREGQIYVKLLDFVGTIPTEPGIINDEWLGDSINGAKNPGVIHCLIGLKKIAAGDVLTGEKHWRIAERQYASARLIINNLMDIAGRERPDEFKNLLEMMSLAIEMFPNQPEFKRTRGVFLATQGRHQEAINDLVFAAEKVPNIIDVHQHLILCYEKTGEVEKLNEQKQILETKLGKLGEAQRKRLESVIGSIAH